MGFEGLGQAEQALGVAPGLGQGVSQLDLQPLGTEAVGQVLADFLGATADQNLSDVAAGTGGNPFLLAELLRGLRDEGRLRFDAGRVNLVGTQLPARLRQSMRVRLGYRSPVAQQLAGVAAVLGRSFTHDQLAAMLERPATVLLAPVEELMDAGLITEDGQRLAFGHDLIREAVLDTMRDSTRRALQRRAVDVFLAEGARRPTWPARPDRSRRLAYAAMLGAAITTETGTVPPLLADAAQAGAGSGISLSSAVAAAFMLLNGDGDVITAHRLVTQVLENQAGLARPGDVGLFGAVSALFVLCELGGRADLWAPFHTAVSRFAADLPAELFLLDQAYADPARTAAAALPQVDAAIASLHGETDHLRILTVSRSSHFTDRYAACREALWRVVREVRQGGAVTPLITALEHLSFDSWMTGQWDQAQELADECLELCLTYGYLPLTWTVRYRQALLAAARGAYDASDELTVEMTEWAAPRRVGQAELAAHHVRSVAALGRGDFAGAYQHAAAISPAGLLASHVGYALWVLLDLTEAAVRTGRHADAAAHVRAMRDAGLEGISPRLSLVVAGAAALTAPSDQARGLFETALATPRADQWPFDLARVRLLYGEWLRRERSTAEARAQLSPALNTFRQLGALPWQARAGNELRAAGLATPAADPGSPLSPLDRQIAELAAAGLTNKQIGERLYLSHRTVAAHLYQVFPRLGITSRAALRDALDALDGPSSVT